MKNIISNQDGENLKKVSDSKQDEAFIKKAKMAKKMKRGKK